MVPSTCVNYEVTTTVTHWGQDKMTVIVKYIFLNENVRIPIKFSLKFVAKHPINNISSLLQIMASYASPGLNSSPPSAAYMRQWIGSPMVQVMACRLFRAKPLPEAMLAYCQLNSWEHTSVKYESEFYHFH